MDDSVKKAVTRAITAMQENLGEPLTVDDLARAAMFSKFHFTRMFQRATGVSPGRFLSALRLQRAKQLLISTSLNVADISTRVGYNSVGTFSSRFSRSVGMSPTTYRRLAGFASQIPTDHNARRGQPSRAVVSGRLRFAEPAGAGLVFIGLFEERIPEGRPVRCAVLDRKDTFRFDSVPPGAWYLLAQAVAGDPLALPQDAESSQRQVAVATHGPLTVREDSIIKVDVTLKPASALDPPVLLALLDARKVALARVDAALLTMAARSPLAQAADEAPAA